MKRGEVLKRKERLFPEKMQTRPARFLASSTSVYAVALHVTRSEHLAEITFSRRNISGGPPPAPVVQAAMQLCHAMQVRRILNPLDRRHDAIFAVDMQVKQLGGGDNTALAASARSPKRQMQ